MPTVPFNELLVETPWVQAWRRFGKIIGYSAMQAVLITLASVSTLLGTNLSVDALVKLVTTQWRFLLLGLAVMFVVSFAAGIEKYLKAQKQQK